MSTHQVAFVRKEYITNIVKAESPQEAWDLIKSSAPVEATIRVYHEIDSLTSINEITEETIDMASLDL